MKIYTVIKTETLNYNGKKFNFFQGERVTENIITKLFPKSFKEIGEYTVVDQPFSKPIETLYPTSPSNKTKSKKKVEDDSL